jgi:hypothetical protein
VRRVVGRAAIWSRWSSPDDIRLARIPRYGGTHRRGPVGSWTATGRPARQRSDMDKKAKTPKKPKQNKTKTAK